MTNKYYLTMAKIKLEFEKLTILRPKERWQLYFVIVAEHPEDNDKMVLTTTPEPYIRLTPRQKNVLNFVPEATDDGADGLFILERDMPEDRRIKVRVYLRHCRKHTRSAGEMLQQVKGQLGKHAFDIVGDMLGAGALPWLVISKEALPLIGGILRSIKDRDFGFVSMDEEFDEEFETQTELDRMNNFSTGDARIVWSWSVDE
ncbi:hypothetical protein NT017_12200 [Prolixibacter sp. NT017]|nr:hypothetical protein NT017_12200 [Prolixibacter sp. NT017]